jgi:hypothetical protein
LDDACFNVLPLCLDVVESDALSPAGKVTCVDKLTDLLPEGDYFILNRGFRDAIDLSNNKCKYKAMPQSLLKNGQKQFTTKEANESRLCTKIRWSVEDEFGLIKSRLRVSDHRVENKSLPHFYADFRIGGDLDNKFSRLLPVRYYLTGKMLLSDRENADQMAHNV